MPVDFFYLPASPSCRSVLLTAKIIGVDLNLKVTNLAAGENRTPEFLKMNPQHTVPTINDNGFYLWESRAILGYLVDKYSKDDSLYPKDPTKRALVNQRLYFDMGTLYHRFGEYYFGSIAFGKGDKSENLKKLEEAFELLDTFLEGQTYVAGKTLTIADLAIISTVSSVEILGFDVTKYPNVKKWYQNAKKKIPSYNELNHTGCIEMKKFFDSLCKK